MKFLQKFKYTEKVTPPWCRKPRRSENPEVMVMPKNTTLRRSIEDGHRGGS